MKLSSFIKGYRAQAALSPVLKMLEAIMELIVPLVVARIIDVGIPSGDRTYVVYACLIIVAFGVLGLVFSLLGQYFAAKVLPPLAKTLAPSGEKHCRFLPEALHEMRKSAAAFCGGRCLFFGEVPRLGLRARGRIRCRPRGGSVKGDAG